MGNSGAQSRKVRKASSEGVRPDLGRDKVRQDLGSC